jgi:ribosomal protein S18 acetylase RimI-like enzyme
LFQTTPRSHHSNRDFSSLKSLLRFLTLKAYTRAVTERHSSNPSGSVEVRSFRLEDRTAVRNICYATGLLGNPIDALVPDRELLADLWTAAYTDGFPELILVATLEGETIGYILGVGDARDLPMVYLRRVLPLVLGRAWRGEYRSWRSSLPHLIRLALEPAMHAPLARFPAHLHINLLESARGRGLGHGLLERFLQRLEARGVPGVQLSTTDRNVAALRLYERAGFQVFSSSETKLYAGSIDGIVNRLVMVRPFGSEKLIPERR